MKIAPAAVALLVAALSGCPREAPPAAVAAPVPSRDDSAELRARVQVLEMREREREDAERQRRYEEEEARERQRMIDIENEARRHNRPR